MKVEKIDRCTWHTVKLMEPLSQITSHQSFRYEWQLETMLVSNDELMLPLSKMTIQMKTMVVID